MQPSKPFLSEKCSNKLLGEISMIIALHSWANALTARDFPVPWGPNKID